MNHLLGKIRIWLIESSVVQSPVPLLNRLSATKKLGAKKLDLQIAGIPFIITFGLYLKTSFLQFILNNGNWQE